MEISFESHWTIFHPSIIVALLIRCLPKTSLHNQQKLLQNEGISISANKPIELFKEGSNGLGETYL